MGTRSLESFFSPKSIVIVGASEREGSLGGAIMRNLTEGGYEGEILPLNTNDYDTVYGIKSFHRVSDLPSVPDLAIICTPAVSVPRVIKQLHALGVVAAMILTGGIARARSWQFRPDSARINSVIKRTRMRILGPDCLGMVVPSRKLNASLLHVPVHSGHMAYVGQSGTLASGVMDWAYSRQIGFSHVVTLGRSDDVTLPDLIDYIAQEPSVRTLLVQIDEIRSGRALVRSLRAASRHKLVLAVKNNRFSESPLTTIAQPKGILHRDLLVDEVFNRAGVLRVNATDELFDCVDALGSRRERFGARLAIIANGRGPAILAMDRLLHDKGQLAELDDKTIQSLKAILPEYIQAQNPVLLNPEIAPEQLSAVGQILIKDSSVDAILFVYSPSLGANPDANAKAVVELASGTRKTILTSWMGEYSVEKARDAFDKARIPTFDTPDNAVKSYMYMVRHQRTQDLLRETPESIEIPFVISQEELQEKVFKSLKPGDFMPPQSAYNLLKFYGFQCADIVYRKSLTSLLAKRDKVTGPWVLRVHHEEYMYPFAYGKNPRDRIRSVVRNLNSKEEIVAGAAALEHLIAERFPDSSIMGYTLQTMHRALDNLQFSFGIGRDPEIGPFLFFGGGGTTADILVDRQVALPPLNANLAEQLIRRSHFYEVLLERSEDPQRDLLTLEHWLIALSHIALNHPTLAGLEVNAIRQKIGSYLVIGLAAEIGKPMRCAILPYPNELEGRYVSRSNTTYLVRPIRGEDEPALNLFYKNLSAESLRMRFFSSRRYFDHRELARLTQIDYDREMAFIAYNGAVMKGVVRVWIDPDNVAAEFSVIIDDLLRGEGLGRHLMERIIDYLKNRGVIQIYGSVLPENKPMLALAERLGFAAKLNREDGVMEIAKTLNRQRHKWQGKRMFSV